MFSKIKKVTINTEPRWTASAYTAGVITKEDVNDLISGRRKQIVVDKKEVSGRDLMELVYVDEDGAMPIPADVATDEDKKDLDEAVWYSTQAKVVEDKRASKAFLECYKALEAGKPIGGSESEAETTKEAPKPKSEQKTTQQKPEGQKKPEQGTKPAQKQPKNGTKPASSGQKSAEKPTRADALLEISDEDFKGMDRKAQIKLISELQGRANAYSTRIGELTKLVKKSAKRGAKADANSEQLYELLRSNVKKSDRALVDQLQEAGEDPIRVAEAYFGLTLTEFKKKGKKNKKSKKSSATPETIGSGVTMLGAKLLVLLEQAQMSEEDIGLLEIDPRKLLDLGEVEAFVRKLGYSADSEVVQALQSVSTAQ